MGDRFSRQFQQALQSLQSLHAERLYLSATILRANIYGVF
jgi:hypothetical protein